MTVTPPPFRSRSFLPSLLFIFPHLFPSSLPYHFILFYFRVSRFFTPRGHVRHLTPTSLAESSFHGHMYSYTHSDIVYDCDLDNCHHYVFS